jgi:muramoyltetrapeptide carboxypeptidase
MPCLNLIYPKRIDVAALSVTTAALSGSVDPASLHAAAERLRARGVHVSVPDAANAQWRYFAGDDDVRLHAFNAVLESDADVVLFTRGGYGISRILHRIDWARVAASGKVFCGYSDITAFSLAALAHGKYVTYAGPLLVDAVPSTDDAAVNDFPWEQFSAVLQNKAFEYAPCTSDVDHGTQQIEGTLWGTNLAMISHLAGTPFMPSIDDGLLIIEDIAESPYRVERMLWQLKHAGILDRQRAIVLGQFTQCEPSPQLRYPYRMSEVIETLRQMVSCPVLTGFPFGHVARKTTLPMGARAALSVNGASYTLQLKVN